jgi:hypothetical protein
VTVVDTGFPSYEHEGEPVDVVFTRNTLHQLPDFWKGIALARVADLLRPGAILRLRALAYVPEPDEADHRIPDAEDLAAHVLTEHSTCTWLLEPLLDHAGFDVLQRVSRRRAYAAYTCRRR